MVSVFDEVRAYLLVGEELDSGVGEDAKECRGVAAEEAQGPILEVDVADSFGGAGPAAGVFLELWVGGLEEDLYAVERRDYGFCLA